MLGRDELRKDRQVENRDLGIEHVREESHQEQLPRRIFGKVACLDLGGWDTHFFQGTTNSFHAERARILAEGLAALDADLQGHRSGFTVMVTTEFGRRLYENASLGTDHGRGFALMTLGSRIKGGRIVGPWPAVIENESPAGPGGMKVAHDYRSVFTEVLRGAMGLERPEAVFPKFTPEKVGLV